ncbi:hypothetical protein NSK_001179 [Nannochloropsis salina CCMP1776]|uniref:UBL3-like ubiquitin domain-containing protein n=1 Tax=Nannochloropsis salina CCMP1776 TaxID=1027361 RepID=A0A4D9D8A9_9STRA|nr:hypothetical protein NSK_001179 [Nannochloropsis salina CCMP1776]|eukprot:TFJ87832.1 hypothetical protein NSK_001179 [Nannochloropsis salina CCMP1776]
MPALLASTQHPSDHIHLRFIFANHDGVSVELSVPLGIRVSELKSRLREAWPEELHTDTSSGGVVSSGNQGTCFDYCSCSPEYDEEGEDRSDSEAEEDYQEEGRAIQAGVSPPRTKAPEVARLRFICMGQGLLRDTCTLQDCRIPCFDTHPTPVNVSIRPAPPRPPRHGDRGHGQKKKKKTLGEDVGGLDGTRGSSLPTACVSCSIM